MKTFSQLDKDGFFVGAVEADESPLEPGIYLIPGGAIDRTPPKKISAGMRYKISGASWAGELIPVIEEPVFIPPTREEIIVLRLAEIEKLQGIASEEEALRAELAEIRA
jgi:hypothetical protein